MQKIYYQGQKGAYSFMAGKYLFPKATMVGKKNFASAFSAPVRHKDALAVLPVDNTVVGGIFEVYDLLFDHKDLKIIGEVMLKINHNLLAKPGTKLKDINKVYSHTKALDQCCGLFREYKNLEAVVYEDTARAARYVSESEIENIAAIAGSTAERFTDLK